MYEWLSEIFGEQNALYAVYIAGAIGFLLLVWVLWFWTRRMSGGVFVHGGRGRKPRLAIVDATAIDSHRRIVLVRRDDVEHLVMIGGQNDFVIERGIGTETAEPAQQPEPPKETPDRARETPAREREKRRPEAPLPQRAPAAVDKPTEQVEKPTEQKAPPPRPAPEPKPAPRPVPEAVSKETRPVIAPEPAQTGLPGDYAEIREEPPMRSAVASTPVQAAGIPAAYAEHAVLASEKADEPVFDIKTDAVAEKPASAGDEAPAFEDHVRASIAEAEATIAAPPANDGSLEDEMQKLLNELTRKK